jgi:hypothetical protein
MSYGTSVHLMAPPEPIELGAGLANGRDEETLWRYDQVNVRMEACTPSTHPHAQCASQVETHGAGKCLTFGDSNIKSMRRSHDNMHNTKGPLYSRKSLEKMEYCKLYKTFTRCTTKKSIPTKNESGPVFHPGGQAFEEDLVQKEQRLAGGSAHEKWRSKETPTDLLRKMELTSSWVSGGFLELAAMRRGRRKTDTRALSCFTYSSSHSTIPKMMLFLLRMLSAWSERMYSSTICFHRRRHSQPRKKLCTCKRQNPCLLGVLQLGTCNECVGLH